jgi:hypothetical protein
MPVHALLIDSVGERLPFFIALKRYKHGNEKGQEKGESNWRYNGPEK